MKASVVLVFFVASVFAAGLQDLPQDTRGFGVWAKVATAGLPQSGPHAGTGKVVYANAVAAPAWKSSKPLPVGSVVVKTTGKPNAPQLVAVMRKSKSGWFYEEYLPAGQGYRLAFGGAGKQAQCVSCHEGARDKDFLFTRP